MSISIRKLSESDLPYVYDICLKTGANGKDAQALFSDPYIIGQYYAAPYLFFELDICFTAINLDSPLKRPAGYIVGTSNSLKYYTWLQNFWLPQLQSMYTVDFPTASNNEKNILNLINRTVDFPSKEILTQYPAHLHIDLLPELQGRGCGKLLIETFINALKKKNCLGVHLGVSKENSNAVGFYKKIGFTILEEFESGYTLGLSF